MQELTNLLALLEKLEVLDHDELARQAMNGTAHAHLEQARALPSRQGKFLRGSLREASQGYRN